MGGGMHVENDTCSGRRARCVCLCVSSVCAFFTGRSSARPLPFRRPEVCLWGWLVDVGVGVGVGGEKGATGGGWR